jgi:carboxyl-terminal processing protease
MAMMNLKIGRNANRDHPNWNISTPGSRASLQLLNSRLLNPSTFKCQAIPSYSGTEGIPAIDHRHDLVPHLGPWTFQHLQPITNQWPKIPVKPSQAKSNHGGGTELHSFFPTFSSPTRDPRPSTLIPPRNSLLFSCESRISEQFLLQYVQGMLIFLKLNAMICKFGRVALLLALVFTLSSKLNAAETPAASGNATNSSLAELKPEPDAGKIAFVTAYMLERLEYMQHSFDPEISARVFDAYLSSLDPQHLHFLQSDLTEFAGYRTNLNRFTMRRTGVADTQPAYEIFYRYMERLKQHVAYVDELLKTEKFDFTADDKAVLNRHDLPYPKNLDDAKAIWRQRLRYEYLMDKISRETQKTNTTAAAKSESNSTPIIHLENADPVTVQKALQAMGRTNTQNAETVLTTPPNHVEKPGPPKTMHEEIVETLGKSYHRTVKVFQDNDSYDILNRYLESLARAYDPHSDYQGKDEYDDFAMMMNLSLQGIGAVLRSEDGYCQIEELMNGPAKASNKIKVHDRIAAVAQSNQPPVDIYEMPITKAVRLIRGPKGSEVRLTIIPAGAPESSRQVVTLIRDEIKLENGEAKGEILEVPGSNGATKRLGIIDLPSFYATIDTSDSPTPRSTTADVAALLKKFHEENVSGVILDLRKNGGGSLEEAIRLAGLFIKEGPIVQIRRAGTNDDVEVREDTDPTIAYDGPLILLTSKFSASASEIVAGALQDYGRALVVGDTTTFGKGTAQQIYYLSRLPVFSDTTHDPGTLKLTNSKFYRASGASTELRGVAADIVLPSVWNDSTEVGETALDNHFPWDTIKSSHYEKVDMVQAELPELARRSSERTATNKEFAYLREDIDRVRKQREDKTVSLNEKQQLADRAQLIAEHQQREKERATRKKDEPKVYDLTVAQAGEPGLPAPAKQTNDVASVVNGEFGFGFSADASSTGRDELTEAVNGESEHAEAARLQEARNILLDYITLLNSRTNKPTAPLVAK